MKWLNEQWNWVKSFLSEPVNGSGVIDKGSSKRLASVGVVFTFMFVYLKTALGSHTIPDIPDTWVFMLGTVLGITGVVDYFKTRTEKKP